ncbi:hypothetical protein AB0K51_27015 [Kitasatospora sp. NPDC049285]
MAFDPAVVRDSFAVVERPADQLTRFFYAHLFTPSTTPPWAPA